MEGEKGGTGGGGGGDDETPLLPSLASSSTELVKPFVNRTGNIWTAFAYIITAVIGSGILSLSWSMAQLGWVAGPLSLLFFASITIVSAFLVSNCYRSPDPENGHTRNNSYLEAVRMILGKRSASLCGMLLQISMFQAGIAFTITSGISMRYAVRTLLLVVSAAMSFTYSIIGTALGLAKVIGNGNVKGDIIGVQTSTTSAKVSLVSQALGDIAFSYPFSMILLEIQDTLKAPPSELVTMKKAAVMVTCTTTFIYFFCGGLGYAAFGNSAPGNLLTGFGFYEPYWLIGFANLCVVVHLFGAYQVYSQPVFAMMERWAAKRFPDNAFINYDNHSLELPLLPAFRANLFRLCVRTAYVASTIIIAIIFPYFNQVLGVAGSIFFWPLVAYFPMEMYFVQKNVGKFTGKRILLHIYSIICLLTSMFALLGSIEGLIAAKFGKDA